MARLAVISDLAFIKRFLPTYDDACILDMITNRARHLTVVAPPDGLFWITLDERDPTLVHAGITFSKSKAQTLEMYKVLIAKNPWPKWTDVMARVNPAICGAAALDAADNVAKMPIIATDNGRQTRKIGKVALLKSLGIKAK